MNNNKLVVGIMGCANIAERMMIPSFNLSPFVTLKYIASRSKNKASEIAKKFNIIPIHGYDELLDIEEINLIYMPLPNGTHFEWAKKAILKGKHLLIEKSITTNIEETIELINLAKTRKIFIQENFQFQFHKQFEYLKKIFSDKIIGDIKCVRSSFGFPPFEDENNIRYSKDLGGGALFDAGAYTLKIIQLLLGNEIKVLNSVMHISNKKDVDISGSGYLLSKNGIVAQIAYGFDNFYQCNIEIWGSKGKIVNERIFTAGPNVKTETVIYTQNGKEVIQGEDDNHFLNIINDCCTCIINGDYNEKYLEIISQSELLQMFNKNSIKINYE